MSQGIVAEIVLDIPDTLKDSVAKGARGIWLENWGADRASGTGSRSNFAKAKATSRSNDKCSEAEFFSKLQSFCAGTDE